jgi:hypothetical protein
MNDTKTKNPKLFGFGCDIFFLFAFYSSLSELNSHPKLPVILLCLIALPHMVFFFKETNVKVVVCNVVLISFKYVKKFLF